MKIQVKPRKTITWEEFLTYPKYSIALDGFVEGEPLVDLDGGHANFNHHERVNRLATRCTASQVNMAIKQGILSVFPADEISLWVNDCDQDVCTAIWLFQTWERILGTKSEPLISRIVANVDALDTCAGAFPIEPGCKIMREMCWIFEPYTAARVEGLIPSLSQSGMESIIEAVTHRLDKYSVGMGEKREPDTRYKVLGGGENWKVVQELGNEARTAMRRDGIQFFISYRGENNNAHTYSVGTLTPFINSKLAHIYAFLNTKEGIDLTNQDRWGGSDSCGGSPRHAGSKLSLEQMQAAMEEYFDARLQ